MSDITHVAILDEGTALALCSNNGRQVRFHACWLRDNALDASSRDPGNGQRLISVLDIPETVSIESAQLNTEDDLLISFAPENKAVEYSVAWLLAHSYDVDRPGGPLWISDDLTTWNASYSGDLYSADFEVLRSEPASLYQWLSAAHRFGVVKISGMSCEPGAVCQAAELFSYVRETNYGRYFDVRSEVNPSNLAYTNLGLQAHTDNPYRDPVPTLQLVTCLESSAEGGESIVVDGFRAVELLQQESPESVELLGHYNAQFEFCGSDGVSLLARRPMIERGSDGELRGLRINNRSIAPLVDVPYAELPAFYAAYRKLVEIIDSPELGVSFKLEPGELFLVDNTRVLHARKAFSGTGTRWLQGCYADKDGLLSALRVLQEQYG